MLEAEWALAEPHVPTAAIMDGTPMSENVDDLILDLLEWIGPGQRGYLEVMDVWRTSCPRLPVWEEANDRGFVERHHVSGQGQVVRVSALGASHLGQSRTQRVVASSS
jgi:trans-aconitate 2-methyltransferase